MSTQKTDMKWKGKQWYQVVTPNYIGDVVIGETLISDPNALKGRVVETSLIDLMEDSEKFHFKMYFKICEVAGNKAFTKFVGHEITRDFIGRAIQTRTTRIDTNDVVTFTDGKLRIKALAVTNKNVSIQVDKAIRAAVRAAVLASAKDRKIEEWVSGMAAGEIQSVIRADLNKVYPIRMFEFRASKLIES